MCQRINIVETGPKAPFDVVERKGLGHPDTLSDELAERLSRKYSKYTKDRYGAILHHNFDKIGLLGGQAMVEFGGGKLQSPIRVLLNGRASARFGDEKIPVEEIVVETAEEFLLERLPRLDPNTDLDIRYNVSTSSSPGGVDNIGDKEGFRDNWFSPRNLDDLRELHELVSNDTSHGCSFAPLSAAECVALEVEESLNSPQYKRNNSWLGSDIKLMVVANDKELSITAAIPQIARYVPDIESYDSNLRAVEDDIRTIATDLAPDRTISVTTNNRDNYERGEFYLTVIGSSIESGDEGLVGRGNRVNGLITPTRPMSIEGQCGKNPVYHVGRIYNVAARRIAERINKQCDVGAEVHLISQTGRDLTNPWWTYVRVRGSDFDREMLEGVVTDELDSIPEITNDWLKGQVRMY